MSWAAKRRLFIVLIIGAVFVAFLSTLFIATFYKAPSCTDNIQNQDEAGIDCGGPCQFLCVVEQQPPTVLFTKALENGIGRTSVIASVENKNPHAAAKDVSYRVRLYSTTHALVQEVFGTFDLPPGATVPVFIPGIPSGKQIVASAFLDMASSSPQWFTLTTDPRIVPLVSNTKQGGTSSAPRIEATLINPSITVLSNVQVIVLVRNEKRDVIAASQTIVPTIPAQGKATATFTWSTAFPGTPASVEVVPIIPLPDR